PRCSKSPSATSRPAASSKSTLRLPSLSSAGNWSVTCCSSGAQLTKHQPSQRFGACTTSWSSLRSKRHFSALTPSVCSVASLTSANSRLNCDALASTSRSVMPVVSAVIVEVPRVKLTAEENPVVTATTSKMRPPSTAMSTMMGLAAGARGGCGSGAGVGLCEVYVMSLPVLAGSRLGTGCFDCRCGLEQQVPDGYRYHRLRVRVFEKLPDRKSVV